MTSPYSPEPYRSDSTANPVEHPDTPTSAPMSSFNPPPQVPQHSGPAERTQRSEGSGQPIAQQYGAPQTSSFSATTESADPYGTVPSASTQASAPFSDAQYAGTSPIPPGSDPSGQYRQGKGAASRRRGSVGWPGVIVASVLSALLASGATFAAVNATGEAVDRPASSESSTLSQSENTSTPVSADVIDWAAVSSQVRPSVVAIRTSTGTSPTGQESGAQGSGVIISTDGDIVTNSHVVTDAEQIQVTLSDGRLYQAELVGDDTATDLAVIRLQDAPDDLVAAELGTSSDLVVGQAVMAVGNPLGLSSTVTTGIISALDRPVTASDGQNPATSVTNAIQIDAAINPGNSGGPLFNSAGQVIGINSSIATTSAQSGSVGLGFAIPVDLVATIANQLMETGQAEHAYLGVTLADGAATADGVTRVGALVGEVQGNTPAQEAGIQNGDVITAINGKAVSSAVALTAYVRTYRSGDTVDITVVRDGVEQTLSATLTTRPDPQS